MLHNKKMCSTDDKKEAGLSKLRWRYRKQVRWHTLTISTLRKLDLVPYCLPWGAVFEKGLRFDKVSHDFKNTPKGNFQNQWSFRICYHSLPETFITSTLLSEITTFVNTNTSIDELDGLSIPSLHQYLDGLLSINSHDHLITRSC